MQSDLLLFIGFTPLALWVVYQDLRHRQIPNMAVLLTLVLILVWGGFYWPWDVILTRALALGGAAIVFSLLYKTGQIGGGDVKYAIALSPYFNWADWRVIVGVLCLSTLVTYATLWATGRNRRNQFPLGVPLSITTFFYLTLAFF